MIQQPQTDKTNYEQEEVQTEMMSESTEYIIEEEVQEVDTSFDTVQKWMTMREEHSNVRHRNTSKKHHQIISEHMSSEFPSSTKDVVEIEVQLNSLLKDKHDIQDLSFTKSFKEPKRQDLSQRLKDITKIRHTRGSQLKQIQSLCQKSFENELDWISRNDLKQRSFNS